MEPIKGAKSKRKSAPHLTLLQEALSTNRLSIPLNLLTIGNIALTINSMKLDKAVIRKRALQLADLGGKNVAAALVAEFGISRQAANTHLARMVAANDLIADGSTRSRIYRLGILEQAIKTYPREGLSEDVVWRELAAPVVKTLPENVRDIWHYGMTEMVNNAIDHSGSVSVHVGIIRNPLQTTGWVMDDGEGIFLKIQKALGLYDPRESILELAKGKLTTDPENHTGEGIFFSSKLFDEYEIRSVNLHFSHAADAPDFLFDRPSGAPGTLVLMKIANDSPRVARKVFNSFAAPEDFTFDKTIVPVRLAQYEGEKLVSRSQAKRLTMRFERFRTVILDFAGVETIGQAFADEVFRVFQSAHPNIRLLSTHVTPDVDGMIKRALAAGDAGRKDLPTT